MKRLIRGFARSLLLCLKDVPMRAPMPFHAAVVLAASVLALGLWGLVGQRVAAGIDLSGRWNAEYSLTCAVTFDQSGNDLSAIVDCGGDVGGTLTGSIESTTGAFSLMGLFGALPVELEGSASPDGNAVSGTWSAPPIVPSGTFSGTREDAAPDSTDLTGAWTFTVGEVFGGSCAVAIEHSGTDLAATIDCEGGPAGTFEGTFDAAAGSMFLSGPFGPFTRLDLEGTVSADGDSFTGTWTIVPVGPSGAMIATRKEGPPSLTPTETAAGVPEATTTAAATPTVALAPPALPAAGAGPAGSSGSTAVWLIASLAAAAFAGAGSIVLGGAARYVRRRRHR